MTKLKFDVAHQVPGRVRMKVPAAKGNPELLQQIAETFAAIPGIERITCNPATGSVVMHYDVHRHDEFHGRFQDHVEQGALVHRRLRKSTNLPAGSGKKPSSWPAIRRAPARSWIFSNAATARSESPRTTVSTWI